MREFKFRAWDKNSKIMFNHEDLMDITKEIVPSYREVSVDTPAILIPHNQPRIELIQYTGLKDKRGKEIYEGDILQSITSISQPGYQLTSVIEGRIQTIIGMTYLVGKQVQYSDDEEISTSNYKCLMLSPLLFEVIGNIYENPELLEVE